jgi:UDP-2-acetamido-3-amino-2,3-dideoxy-glucuronate N-acetyltransferase
VQPSLLPGGEDQDEIDCFRFRDIVYAAPIWPQSGPKWAAQLLPCITMVISGSSQQRMASIVPIAANVECAEGVKVFYPDLVNLYGCKIGAESRIGIFVEVQSGVSIGARCKISSHSFVCEGVTIEDEVFIAHGVMFSNDRLPRAANEDGTLMAGGDWKLEPTRVKSRASIGSGAVILPGVVIGEGALVGAGAVVTKSVPDHAIVAGNPARVVGDVRRRAATS